MTKTAPDLAPNKLLSGLKSLFRFSSDIAEQKRKEAEQAAHERALRDGPAWEQLSKHPGWELMKRALEAEIDGLLKMLEKGGEDEKLLRVKIQTFRLVLEKVPNGIAAAETARVVLEKKEEM